MSCCLVVFVSDGTEDCEKQRKANTAIHIVSASANLQSEKDHSNCCSKTSQDQFAPVPFPRDNSVEKRVSHFHKIDMFWASKPGHSALGSLQNYDNFIVVHVVLFKELFHGRIQFRKKIHNFIQ